MLTVADVKNDVKRVLGAPSDDAFYSRLNDIVDILSVESDWDPLIGFVDVTVNDDRTFALPREVGQVLAVTFDGIPALAHDRWFRYHLNGPGMCGPRAGQHWTEVDPTATAVDVPIEGAYLIAYTETSDDDDAYVRIEGYDENGDWVRSSESGKIIDGILMPLNYSSPVAESASKFSKITAVVKGETAGMITLKYVADDASEVQIGEYRPLDTVGRYRRIQVSRDSITARCAFRRLTERYSDDHDIIPLSSKYAIVTMAKALKKLDEDRFEEFAAYKAAAVDFLKKKQAALEVPSGPTIQVASGNLIADKTDRLDW